jgi:4-methyl-5(b-hydroxyethyl)-thiazole monophosphate biosynthesis
MKTKVLLLVPQGVELYEFSAFYDVFGWAAQAAPESVELVCAGLRNDVTSTFGLQLVLEHRISDLVLDEFAALAVPGGFEEYGFYDDAFSEDFSDLIRSFHDADKPIASICVGALPVAKSGILNGRCATTYALGGGTRRRQLAELGADVQDALVVVDGKVITSTGPGTAVEVALRLLAMVTSEDLAGQVRVAMGFRAF